MSRLVVGITGASGIIYGVRFLEVCKEIGVETYVVVSPAAYETIAIETDYGKDIVEKLATKVFGFRDVAAPMSSGSFKTDGMAVIPCSMKTLAGIAHGYEDNLLIRSALVTLKEGRRLVLVVRESPLNRIHLLNMLLANEAGAVILPASPGFYHKPKTIQDLVDHIVGKVLDSFNIEHKLYERWQGVQSHRRSRKE
jgi:4-hydroxy-3-polyprenylbenzoate decarboxylase